MEALYCVQTLMVEIVCQTRFYDVNYGELLMTYYSSGLAKTFMESGKLRLWGSYI